jgi:hypothetical protein
LYAFLPFFSFSDILLSTEKLYHMYLSRETPVEARQMFVVLTFRRPPPEIEGGAGEEEAGAASTAPANKDVTVMTVQVGPTDSIDSLNRRIRVIFFFF